MKSFKQMIQGGEIKRADAMKITLADIHEEAGFNLRTEGAELAASIEALADHIMAGGIIPAIEVRPREAGGVWIVDGHRRTRALRLAVSRGAPIEWVNVVAFNGNDADRVARVITSAEGRNLSPLEIATGCKRLEAFGLTPQEIAAKISKTPQYVAQLLTLANANTDVQKLVAAGEVSAAVATKAVRAHGEDAGAVLGDELKKAKAAGKKKVTEGTIKAGKPKAVPQAPAKLPQALVDELVASAAALVGSLGVDTRTVLAVGESKGTGFVADTLVTVPAGFLLELVVASAAIDTERKQQRAEELAAAQAAGQQDLAA